MPLNFDYSRCVDRENWTDFDRAALDFFIWGTMCVDIGEITNYNLEEWLFRMRLFDMVSDRPFFEAVCVGEDGTLVKTELGLEHLRKFIGLQCNVNTTKRRDWLKRFLNMAEERGMLLVRCAIEEADDEQGEDECFVYSPDVSALASKE